MVAASPLSPTSHTSHTSPTPQETATPTQKPTLASNITVLKLEIAAKTAMPSGCSHTIHHSGNVSGKNRQDLRQTANGTHAIESPKSRRSQDRRPHLATCRALAAKNRQRSGNQSGKKSVTIPATYRQKIGNHSGNISAPPPPPIFAAHTPLPRTGKGAASRGGVIPATSPHPPRHQSRRAAPSLQAKRVGSWVCTARSLRMAY